MKKCVKIKEVRAIEILDSEGNPTIEVEIELENGVKERASMPSGVTSGSFEAVELRDNDKSRYMGKGVKKAVENVNKKIAKKIIGMNALDQKKVDEELIKFD